MSGIVSTSWRVRSLTRRVVHLGRIVLHEVTKDVESSQSASILLKL
ncbi:hypothetical protein XELAEV_18032277mg [Xenopus laevis]|uniref:Uncharacterized protein n=1 Tax=Xenopus laevis TaxID=8355 RepID=A0A974CQE1_XENLA|nr:hypothetical protein XELAEV_18032277mg [Xenopus laevis]